VAHRFAGSRPWAPIPVDPFPWSCRFMVAPFRSSFCVPGRPAERQPLSVAAATDSVGAVEGDAGVLVPSGTPLVHFVPSPKLPFTAIVHDVSHVAACATPPHGTSAGWP